MKRTLPFALAVIAAGCAADNRDSFAPDGSSDGVDCEVQGASYLVQDIVDATGLNHYTCDAPSVAADGPSFDGWFAPTTVVPGGLLNVTLFTDHAEDLPGRTLVLDAPEVLGHSRFELGEEHLDERGVRFQVLIRPNLVAGQQTLRVALLDDDGDGEATGPVVEIPVHVVDIDTAPRGLRVSLSFWSEEDPDAAPDVNLQVFEPDGNRVDAQAPTSANGAQLEFDGNSACEATGNLESISWPQDAAAGRYSAYAFFLDTCGYDVDFHWTVSFAYFDRLIGIWEGEIGPPHDPDEAEQDIIDLSWVELQ